MKLIKYLLFIIFLVISLIFIINLMEENDESFIKKTYLNTSYAAASEDSSKTAVDQVMIKIPFTEPDSQGMKVWIFFLAVLTCGVILGFFIALVQIVSQKREIIYQRSKLKKLQSELDTLRNKNVDENLILSDDLDDENDLDIIPD